MAKMKSWGDPPFFRMSHEFELEKLSASAILVMVSLSKHMNDETRQSYVSYETLRKETHKSNATIAKALRELREMGFVGRKRRFNSSNIYSLVIPSELVQDASPSVVTHQSVRGKKTVRTRVETNNKPNIRSKGKKRSAQLPPVDPNMESYDYYG